MEEFACLMDWDLEAIVRGSTNLEATSMMDDLINPSFSYFFAEQLDHELLGGFPEFSETTRVLDDLEELYKPFYPVLHPLSSPHTIDVVASSIPSIPKEPEEVKASEHVASQELQVPAASKCKKSKKKEKKSVVKQVRKGEGLEDAWAWRKYGQKPIKGSPYPRSYYRCSSSKGCLARKQVERSHIDPAVFLVTYTAEHSHPHPTRRNSLAGTTRKNNSLAPPHQSSSSNSSSQSLVKVIVTESPLVVSSNINQGLKKEEAFLDPSTDLEELLGFEYQQLALDGNDFMHAFADTV